MDYRPFHLSRIGAAHIRGELPCQDASASYSFPGVQIAVVADGHGNRRHFRSDRGSAMACRIAMEQIRALFPENGPSGIPTEKQLTQLKQNICDAWTDAVMEDYRKDPWTEAELAEERTLLTEDQFARLTDGTDAAIAYGSTLCAAFAYDGGWAAVQLGDGGFTCIRADGVYDWPMPESLVNEGNRTASLCMHDPMRDFRHCSGTDRPAGLLVYTDGIEKVFPPQGKEIVSLLHWIWRNEYAAEDAREGNLTHTLDLLTRRSSIGDDVSVAGLTDPEAEDAEPSAGRGQKMKELDRLYARLEEINSSIVYKKKQLTEISGRSSAQTREQVERILQRNQEEASVLQEQITALREELNLEPDNFPEQEPLYDPPEPEPEPEDEFFPDPDSDAYEDTEPDSGFWPAPESDETVPPEDPEFRNPKPGTDSASQKVKNLMRFIRRMMDDF